MLPVESSRFQVELALHGSQQNSCVMPGNTEIADSSISCGAAALLQRYVKAYPNRLTFLKQQRSENVIQSHWRRLVEQRELDHFAALSSCVMPGMPKLLIRPLLVLP